MANILVSIVSIQTIPNYLFIKEYRTIINKFIFISTRKMEEKEITKLICETSCIEKNNYITLEINEDQLYSNIELLDKTKFSDDDNYYINITGGTKMMAISVWRFFKRFNNVRYFYVPLGKNVYNELLDDEPTKIYNFNIKITCNEYLKIYGIRYEQTKMLFDENQVYEIYNEIKSYNFDIENIPNEILLKFNIKSLNNQVYTKWFEEFIYFKIKRILSLSKKQILTGIKIFDIKEEKKIVKYSNDNEIDIFFLYNNQPYVIECKYSIGKEKIESIIYKLSSINKRFGISVKSTVITLKSISNFSHESKFYLQRRCEITNVKYPIFKEDILDNFETKLKEFISS